MHEQSLILNLIKKVEEIAEKHSSGRVVKVKIRLGALSNITPGHFREHFEQAIAGTIAEGASLDVTELTDISDEHAQDILLENVELAGK